MKQDGVSNDSDRVPSHGMWVNSFLCTHKKTDRDPDLEVSGAGSQVRGVSETHRSGQGSGQGFQITAGRSRSRAGLSRLPRPDLAVLFFRKKKTV
jgi:hypothetical protein